MFFCGVGILRVKIKLSILEPHFFEEMLDVTVVTKNVNTFSKLYLIPILAQQSVYCLPYVEDLRPSHIIC